MVYQPNIPTGTVDLNVDYQNLLGNFQALDTTFGKDHVTFSNATPQNGYHQDIHFNPFSTTTTNGPNNYVASTAGTSTQYPDSAAVLPPAVPPVVSGIGQLWSAEVNDGVNTDTGLYWLTGGGRKVAMTRNFTPAATINSGFTFLPGGIILQWGAVSINALTTATINFPMTFPNAFLNLQTTALTTAAPPAGLTATMFARTNPILSSTASVQISNTQNAILGVFWMAIGY